MSFTHFCFPLTYPLPFLMVLVSLPGAGLVICHCKDCCNPSGILFCSKNVLVWTINCLVLLIGNCWGNWQPLIEQERKIPGFCGVAQDIVILEGVSRLFLWPELSWISENYFPSEPVLVSNFSAKLLPFPGSADNIYTYIFIYTHIGNFILIVVQKLKFGKVQIRYI